MKPYLHWLYKTDAALDAFTVWMSVPIALVVVWLMVEIARVGDWTALVSPMSISAYWYLAFRIARRRQKQRRARFTKP